jgi:hypothetical protein
MDGDDNIENRFCGAGAASFCWDQSSEVNLVLNFAVFLRYIQ